MSLDETLAARTAQYGHFTDHARLLEQLQAVCVPTHPDRWEAPMRVGLHYILGKLCRLLVGNPHHADTWQDIAGYALLVARTVEGTPPVGASPPAVGGCLAGATLAQDLDAVGLRPPWVVSRELSGCGGRSAWYGDLRTHGLGLGECAWCPEQDYEYAFWLMECCAIERVPFHVGLEDVPHAVITAALAQARGAGGVPP